MSSKFYAKAYDILAPMATFLHPIAVEGLENVPKDEPVVLCPNHSSNWDPILLICALGREVNLRIMGKNQLFKIPILRSFLRKMGVFPVDRGHSDIGAVKNSIQSLKDGAMLMVFPEGTRVRGKKNAVRPKGGIAMIAIRSGVKLLPVYIGVKKRLFAKVPIIFGKPFDPEYTGRKGTAEEYQANADEVMRRAYALGGAPCR